MIDKEYLKTLNVLYYEPDSNLAVTISNVFFKNFGEVFNYNESQDILKELNLFKTKYKKLDLVIMEIGDINNDGHKVLNSIREMFPDIDIYIVSAYSNSSYLLQAIKAKVTDYILKPLDLKYLFTTISKRKPKTFDFHDWLSKNIPTPKFQFSNVVVVHENLIGCIVKTWGASKNRGIHYEVYVRSWNRIEEFNEEDIKHFVYDKALEEEVVYD